MLDRVDIRNRQGALLSLPMGDDAGGLYILEIEGLDPVKATVTSSSFANSDVRTLHNVERDQRNIKITMALEPDYIETSVQDLRNRLYNFFMTKSDAMLRFHDTDASYVDIWGTVEEFNSPLFSKDPEAVVSLVCLDSDFINPVKKTFAGTTTSGDVEGTLTYEGTVEAGFVFTLSPNRPLNEFTIYHRSPNGDYKQMDFSAPLLSGDKLIISTLAGNKGALLTRQGTESTILWGLSPQSPWLELENGENDIRVYAEGAAIPFTIDYLVRLGGL